jgi:uncharacterized membrane protein
MPLLYAGLLGVFTGLRTMTPVAVLCWYAYLHALHLEGWQAFLAHIVSAILFTVLALGEYAGDKLPNTPSRIGAVGLAGRTLFGGLLGYVVAQPLGSSPVVSLLCGVLGALAGAYAGWFVRTRSVAALKSADWPVAVAEDCVAITGSILVLNAIVAATRTSY